VGEPVFAESSRHAPHLLDVEVAHALRRYVAADQLEAPRALEDLAEFPLTRHAHPLSLERVFELRHSLSAYFAVYVALAEGLGATAHLRPSAGEDSAYARQGRASWLTRGNQGVIR